MTIRWNLPLFHPQRKKLYYMCAYWQDDKIQKKRTTFPVSLIAARTTSYSILHQTSTNLSWRLMVCLRTSVSVQYELLLHRWDYSKVANQETSWGLDRRLLSSHRTTSAYEEQWEGRRTIIIRNPNLDVKLVVMDFTLALQVVVVDLGLVFSVQDFSFSLRRNKALSNAREPGRTYHGEFALCCWLIRWS